MEVSTDWLRRGLTSIGKKPKTSATTAGRLYQHLKAMQREAERLAAEQPSVDGLAQAKLDAILARREFRGVHGPTWFDRQLERFRAWLAKWTNRLGTKLAGHPGVTKAILWILLVGGAGGLLSWMVRQLLHLRGARDLQPRAPEVPVPASCRQMAQVREAAARGEYREAIRLAYWAAIQRLEELGLWSLDPTRTHREYLRLVSPGQPQREPLAALTQQFERVWYAALPASQNDFQTVSTQLEKLGCE